MIHRRHARFPHHRSGQRRRDLPRWSDHHPSRRGASDGWIADDVNPESAEKSKGFAPVVQTRKRPPSTKKPLVSKALDKPYYVLYLFSLTPKDRVAVNCAKA
jgi:hypothetical protein